MIVTTGKIVVVEAGYEESFRFERDSRTPGVVTVQKTRKTDEEPWQFTLPGNVNDATHFVAGYMRAVHEPVGYKKSESENVSDYTDKDLERLIVEFRKRPAEEQIALLQYATEAWPLVGTPTP